MFRVTLSVYFGRRQVLSLFRRQRRSGTIEEVARLLKEARFPRISQHEVEQRPPIVAEHEPHRFHGVIGSRRRQQEHLSMLAAQFEQPRSHSFAARVQIGSGVGTPLVKEAAALQPELVLSVDVFGGVVYVSKVVARAGGAVSVDGVHETSADHH